MDTICQNEEGGAMKYQKKVKIKVCKKSPCSNDFDLDELVMWCNLRVQQFFFLRAFKSKTFLKNSYFFKDFSGAIYNFFCQMS